MKGSEVKLIGGLVLCAFVLSSCAGIKTRRDLKDPKVETAGDVKSPLGEGPQPTPRDASMEVEVNLRIEPPKVGVLFGPGGFKSFAAIGVLKALEEKRIPIHAVAGLGWGAVVAGTYAKEASLHELEWQLLKLKASDLPSRSLITGSISKVKASRFFESHLGKRVLDAQAEKLDLPVGCPVVSVVTGKSRWVSRGSLRQVFDQCLAYPPYFEDQKGWWGGAYMVQEAIDHLKSQGAELIIYVNAFGEGDLFSKKEAEKLGVEALIWQQLRAHVRFDTTKEVKVLNLATDRFPLFDDSGAKRLIGLGQSAGEDFAEALLKEYNF